MAIDRRRYNQNLKTFVKKETLDKWHFDSPAFVAGQMTLGFT
jgi:hypothetical protein